jgi:transposase
MKTLTVGVDVSQDTLDVAIVIPESQEVIDLGCFPNNQEGFNKIAKEVSQQTAQTKAEIVHLVIEPTGGYEQPFVCFAIELGWRISKPNPHYVRQWAKGTGQRAKTDKVDARNLAKYGASQPLPEWKPLKEPIASLEQLLKRQEEIQSLLRQEKNRLHALKAKGIKNSVILVSLERIIATMENELKLISDEIERLIHEDKDIKEQLDLLKTTPGIGNKNGVFILVMFHRWQLFSTGKDDDKALTAYTGLDSSTHQSGTSVHKHGAISRQGNAKIRSLLYMGALSSIRGDNPVATFYHRLVNRGKAKKVALVAAARKILIWAWAVFSKKTTFDSSKLSLPVSN